MASQGNIQSDGSYESRNDLALRSAVADPVAEPRINPETPKSPTSPKSKRLSLKGSEAMQSQSQANGNPKKSKESSKAPKVS